MQTSAMHFRLWHNTEWGENLFPITFLHFEGPHFDKINSELTAFEAQHQTGDGWRRKETLKHFYFSHP